MLYNTIALLYKCIAHVDMILGAITGFSVYIIKHTDAHVFYFTRADIYFCM